VRRSIRRSMKRPTGLRYGLTHRCAHSSGRRGYTRRPSDECIDSADHPARVHASRSGRHVHARFRIAPRGGEGRRLRRRTWRSIQTSGTTARPKAVPLTHRVLVEPMLSYARRLGLTSADRCLCVTPLSRGPASDAPSGACGGWQRRMHARTQRELVR
jgi:acyl-CoA synthetase (AMP-forming)/AMP-acid ligase II